MSYSVLLVSLLKIFINAASAASSLTHFEVAPPATNVAITQVRGPHLVWPQVHPTRLLLSIGGTSSTPQDFSEIDELAASIGYSVLALDYPDQVVSTVCREHPSSDCFDLFRAEIVSGTQGSPWVKVDLANSIETRLKSLLRYLVEKSPTEWSPFVVGSGDAMEPNWSKMTVIGHSQGAGHAAYLSKLHGLQRAILLAGPQDVSSLGVAKWVSRDSATYTRRLRAFLHKNDIFDESQQLSVLRVLLQNPKLVPVHVLEQAPSVGTLVVQSDVPEEDPHNSVLRSKAYVKIWRSLLD